MRKALIIVDFPELFGPTKILHVSSETEYDFSALKLLNFIELMLATTRSLSLVLISYTIGKTRRPSYSHDSVGFLEALSIGFDRLGLNVRF
ncbi:hypothetical protein D9M71_839360 [compost metagenome]